MLTLYDDLTPKELEMMKDVIQGQASVGWGGAFKNRDIDMDIGEANISFFNKSKSWFLKTAEEMGLTNNQTMGGMKLE